MQMKFFLGVMVMLLVVVGYYSSLCLGTDAVMRQLTGMHHTYGAVADTADEWQQGDLSVNFSVAR
jgi:hypothetical protein